MGINGIANPKCTGKERIGFARYIYIRYERVCAARHDVKCQFARDEKSEQDGEVDEDSAAEIFEPVRLHLINVLRPKHCAKAVLFAALGPYPLPFARYAILTVSRLDPEEPTETPRPARSAA